MKKYWIGSQMFPGMPFAAFIFGEVCGEWEKGPVLKNIGRWHETEQGTIQMSDGVFTSEVGTKVDSNLYALSRYVDTESDVRLASKIEESISKMRAQRSGLVAPGGNDPRG